MLDCASVLLFFQWECVALTVHGCLNRRGKPKSRLRRSPEDPWLLTLHGLDHLMDKVFEEFEHD